MKALSHVNAVKVIFENEVPKHRSHKNTRRWCRGKPGVLHKFTWKTTACYTGLNYPNGRPMHYSCNACGKIQGAWFPPWQRLDGTLNWICGPRPEEGSQGSR